MLEVGRVCVKLAGREAGRKCVVVKTIDKNFVLIDGDVKRRQCNVDHLMPLVHVISIKGSAKSEDIKSELSKLGLIDKEVKRKAKKAKDKVPRPKKQKIRKKPEGADIKPAVKKAKPAKKPVAKKPAKKAKPAKKPAAKKSATKKSPAKKATAKKPAVKKAKPAKKKK